MLNKYKSKFGVVAITEEIVAISTQGSPTPCGDLLNSVSPLGSFTEACIVYGDKEIKYIGLFAFPGIQAYTGNHVTLVEGKRR